MTPQGTIGRTGRRDRPESDIAEQAARVFWTELERLDPTPGTEEPSAWEELSELDRDLYVRAMRRALSDVAQAVPTTTR
jgi:hypothetical protein